MYINDFIDNYTNGFIDNYTNDFSFSLSNDFVLVFPTIVTCFSNDFEVWSELHNVGTYVKKPLVHGPLDKNRWIF